MYMHVSIRICLYMNVCICVNMMCDASALFAYACVYMFKCVCVYIHTYIHKPMAICFISKCGFTYVYVYIYVYVCIYIHTYMHTFTDALEGLKSHIYINIYT
jgi:hypothetical protein